jgi:hypothetical protein
MLEKLRHFTEVERPVIDDGAKFYIVKSADTATKRFNVRLIAATFS